ncbi:MAG: hypothetical protein M9894_25275 [Planctomycetes bacterium]|nr:hypothetical protein [Planctomycetota bacterium]
MSRLFGLALACALVAPAAGCIAQDDRRIGREMAHDDLPRCYQRARFLEERGLEALDEGGAARSKERQRELYDQAIRYFRDAVGLYEDELIRDAQAPAERRRNAELEIERLEGMITRTHKARPL